MSATGTRQILFIQGGGEGTHDEWDDKLVDSLRTGTNVKEKGQARGSRAWPG